MRLSVKHGKIGGEIKAIPSKSYAHRYLICAGLSDDKTELYCPFSSEDIEATIDCLSSLGAEISREGDYILVKGINRRPDDLRHLQCRESGSTLRFLLPVTGALGGSYSLFSRGRLPSRPLSPLYEELTGHGLMLGKQGESPLYVEGALKNGTYRIPGNISSQYISGLLFALPLLKGVSRIDITTSVESSSYIDLTLEVLEKAGIEISKQDERTFLVKGNQKYNLSGRHEIEGDWSNAAYFLCMSALSDGNVAVENLNPDSLQGDRKVLEILKSFGYEVCEESGRLRVKKGELKPARIDASEIPDIIPPLAVMACGCSGRTEIINASRLSLKESDRLSAIGEILKILGADIITDKDSMIINGNGKLQGGCVSSFNDHRMAMMAALAGMICENEVVIDGAEAVSKSYPDFFKDIKKIGFEVEEL